MAHIMRKLTKALAKRGQRIERKDDHMLIIRNYDKHVVCDFDLSGMDKEMLRSNMELLLLVVTQ
ncbi:MAG: hypothetical protein J6Y20_10140 [Lachnospiraceae bacterium]|nr:hypothetical protein [Lachnospiraceae bacterium]MBP5462473.1 hypothetical protein [Lachnospiraceae bacterium]